MVQSGCQVGDACDSRIYQVVLGGEKAALLCTDPPYCLLTRRRKHGDPRERRAGVKIDLEPIVRFDDVRAYRKFTECWLPKAAAHCSGALVIWTNYLGKSPIQAVALEIGYQRVGEFIWAKRTSPGDGNEVTLRVYESALVFSKDPLPILRAEDPARVWCVAAGYDDDGEAMSCGGHPNHKPFTVVEPLIRAWSRPKDLVLDPFAGSGSIPAAALRLGRRAACSEIEPQWASRVTQRLETLQG